MHAWTNMVGACIYIFERSIRLSENRHRSRAAPIPCDVSSLLLLLLPSDLCFTETEILAPFSQIPSPKKPFNRVPRSGSRRRYFQRKGTEYRNIAPATSEREENLDGAYVSYGGNRKPGFGARTGEERESARTNAPTFPATLYPLLSLSPLLPSFSCFSRCRASAPKTRLYRAGCDWSVDPVIHRKRRMQTVT